MKSYVRKSYLVLRKLILLPFLLFRKTRLPKKNEIKKILLIRNDRIGDMVVSTPVFRALKEYFPDAWVSVLASSSNKDILLHNPYVDEILTYEGLGKFIKDARSKKFDIAIDLFITYAFYQAFLAFLSKAVYRLGFDDSGREIFFNVEGVRPDPAMRVSEQLLGLLGQIGVEKNAYEPQLFLSTEEIAWAKDFLSSHCPHPGSTIIAMHPGGFSQSQRWPAKYFSELGKMILEKYKAVILIFGDKKEGSLIKEIAKSAGEGAIVTCDAFSLRRVISLLSQSHLFIGNNSGLLHIASALGILTVSTLGPTDPNLWWPRGEKNIVVYKGLPCSPCNKPMCKRHDCLASITVDEMMSAVQTQLASTQA